MSEAVHYDLGFCGLRPCRGEGPRVMDRERVTCGRCRVVLGTPEFSGILAAAEKRWQAEEARRDRAAREAGAAWRREHACPNADQCYCMCDRCLVGKQSGVVAGYTHCRLHDQGCHLNCLSNA